MTQRLAGKTAVVTAAGQGIGRATVLAFVREGAKVIASDINATALASLAADCGCTTLRLDVTDAAAINAAAAAHGPVDMLFNAAGCVHAGTVLECSEADWDFAFQLNVRSQFRSIKAFLPGMLAEGGSSSSQPMGRLGRVDEIAALAVCLSSDEAAFTTGTAQVIDGGWFN